MTPTGPPPAQPSPVAHAAEAKAHLAAIPRRLKAIVTGDNVDAVQRSMQTSKIAAVLGVLAVPAAAVADLLDPVVQPARILADLGNAAVQGTLAGIDRLLSPCQIGARQIHGLPCVRRTVPPSTPPP